MNIDHAKLIEDGAKAFTKLMEESQEKLEEAWAGVLEEAELQETTPKLKVGFGIVLDVEEHRIEYALTFAVRHKRSIEVELTDPDQHELPIDDEAPRGKGKRVNA